jgi:hypothetical protein
VLNVCLTSTRTVFSGARVRCWDGERVHVTSRSTAPAREIIAWSPNAVAFRLASCAVAREDRDLGCLHIGA